MKQSNTFNRITGKNCCPIIKIMKITVILCFTCVFSLFANKSYSQQTKLSLNLKNATLSQLFSTIEKESEFVFIISDEAGGELSKRVDVDVDNENVSAVLNTALNNTQLSYLVTGRQITIYKDSSKNTLSATNNSKGVAQQKKRVSGRIADQKNEPLIGVAIQEIGTNNGTISDIDGNFNLSVAPDAVLRFSYLGFKPLERPVDGQTIINVILVESVAGLDEVVVVGYGVQQRKHLTGAVAQIESEDLVRSPMSNVSQMLTGKLPGLTSVQSSGIPGNDQTNLLVRGISSFGNASPLLIVDGVERMLNTINPNDVESVTILKDAAASAVYGIRGANGVILITTKRGSESKTHIAYDGSATFSFNTRFPKFLDGPSFIYWFDKAREMDGLPRLYDADVQSKVLNNYDPDGIYGNTDWVDELFKDYGFAHQHNLSVRGGNEKIKHYTSLGFLDQDGIVDNVSYKRYNIRSNIDTKITNNLTFSLNLNGFYEDRQWPGISLSPGAYLNPIHQALLAGPILRQYDNDGLPLGWLSSGTDTQNPVASVNQGGFSKMDRKQFEGLGKLEYSVPQVEGLKIALEAAYYTSQTNNDNYLATYKVRAYNRDSKTTYITDAAGTGSGSFNKSSSSGSELMIRPSISYNNTFDKHTVGALFIYEQSESNGSTMTAGRKGYPLSFPIDINTGTGEYTTPSGSHSKGAEIGYVGRLNYAYDDRFLAEFSFRVDGSYKFIEDKRWGFFPSLSLGWNISQEKFMQAALPDINILKIRGSVGELGNDSDIGALMFRRTYEVTKGFNYAFGNPITPQGSVYTKNAVPSIVTWSRTRSSNIGFELTAWEGLLSVEFDWFYKYTYDLLESISGSYPPSIGGYYQNNFNSGRVDNRGFEIVLKHRNKVGQVSYDVTGNLAWARNRVLSRHQSDGLPSYRNAIGNPVTQIYGYRAIGLYQTQEQIDNRPTGPGGVQRLGDLMYEDINGDGVIDVTNDFVKIGRATTPELTFSFVTNVSYKNFDLYALWQGAAICDIVLSHTSNSVYDNTMYTRPFYGGGNAPYYLVEGAWTDENTTDAKYPRLSTQWNSNNGWPSSWWVVDGAYLRLKSAQLGYTVPGSFLKKSKTGLEQCRIYVSGTNLLTFNSFKYVDPEMTNVNNGYYPQQRTVSVGVNLTF